MPCNGRMLLAVTYDGEPLGRHPEGGQVLEGRLGAPLAQGQVVFR